MNNIKCDACLSKHHYGVTDLLRKVKMCSFMASNDVLENDAILRQMCHTTVTVVQGLVISTTVLLRNFSLLG